MEIEIFTLCDHAQDFNGKLAIIGTFDSVYAPQFPFTHPACCIAGRLRFSDKEAGAHKFELRLIDDMGKDITERLEGTLEINKPAIGFHSTINFVFNFSQLVFDKPGRYSFEMYIDDEWRSGLPLMIVKPESRMA